MVQSADSGLLYQLMQIQVLFVKVGFLLFFVYLLNCQLVVASNDTTYEKVGRLLHSELKYVESEIMRVWVTIDALQDKMHQNPDAISGEMNRNLADLYFYESQLNDYLAALKTQLSVLEDPSGIIFAKEQFEPLHFSIMTGRMPRGAIPVSDAYDIKVRKAGP